MKNLLKLILSVIVGSLLWAGCATNPTTGQREFNAERTAKVLREMLPPAIKVAVTETPEAKQWILDAKVAVCGLVDSGKVTPADLKAAVASTGVNEINTPEREAVIQAAFSIYQSAYSDAIAKRLDPSVMIPILKGICDGLSDGLN